MAGRDNSSTVAENTGFVVFKDHKVVTFYCNDLAATPSSLNMEVNEESVYCVHGLATLDRWLGHEAMDQSGLKVPAIVVAYNIFMNAVDRFDQMRATHATERREQRITMSIFTFLIDAAIQNGYAVMKQLYPENKISQKEYKRRVAEQLVAEHLNAQKKRPAEAEAEKNKSHSMLDNVDQPHVLLENMGKARRACYLCHLLKETRKMTFYSCIACKKAYHPNCFSMYHYRDLWKNERPQLYAKLQAAESKPNIHPHHQLTICSSLLTAHVPGEE
jgi:hypothetical protein